ncbi:MCE family protein [Nocardioides sp. NPDC059952]|uniref:MCE family protein n=1 Tax=Nocardioides sp. NPDC059952 TaxID=3347014 RepID=UPI00365C45B2
MRRLAIALAAGSVAMSGCSFTGVQDLPLPGAVHGDDTYPVTVVFADANNLVPNETCRMNDAIVGSVESVTLGKDLRAHVVCRVRRSVKLSANLSPTLAETSLLGERYVALEPPAGEEERGVLAAGATIEEAATHISPNVEVVLSALSQVLNGGNLGKVASIVDELNAVLTGTDVPATLKALERFVATMDTNRATLVRTLDSLDRFAARLAEQRRAIAAAIDSVPAGLRVLEQERPQVVSTLVAVQDLSERATTVIDRSKRATVADLERLVPVMESLASSGNDLAMMIERLSTFPFPTNTMAVMKGDYGGALANIVVDVDLLNQLLMPQAGSLAAETAKDAADGAASTQQKEGPDPLAELPLGDLLGSAPPMDLGGILGGMLGGGTP